MGTYDTMVGGPVGDTNFPQQLLHQLQQHQMMDVSFALSLSENINNLQTERKLNSEFGKLIKLTAKIESGLFRRCDHHISNSTFTNLQRAEA